MDDIKLLADFLFVAKSKTYAGRGPKAPSSRPNSEDYHYEEGSWIYHDCYWGGAAFIGHEIVWRNGNPVWGLNYYGGPVGNKVDTNAAYDFLKTALRSLDHTIPPLRGPRAFQENAYQYTNKIIGDLKKFEGIEEVSKDGVVVCRHIYHGGLIL